MSANGAPGETFLRLILASTSPYRQRQLRQLNLPFEAHSPGVDENQFVSNAPPNDLPAILARAKATALSQREPQATVIGGDQIALLDGKILGKPGTREQAVAQLTLLSGRTHELITSIAVIQADGWRFHTDVTRLTMRRLTKNEIGRYVDFDQPLDCAGSYKWESLGVALFEKIESSDATAILGLPLLALTTILRDLGFSIP
jgi:septum formation protein